MCVLQVVGQDNSGAESVYERRHMYLRETVPVVPVPITICILYAFVPVPVVEVVLETIKTI